MREEIKDTFNKNDVSNTVQLSLIDLKPVPTLPTSDSDNNSKAFEPSFLEMGNLFCSSDVERRQKDNTAKPEANGTIPDVLNDYFDGIHKRFEKKEGTGKEETKTVKWNGDTITLKSKDGVDTYFKSKDGEWDSKDGNTWVRKDSNDRDIWHGKISVDAKDNVTEEGASFGTKQVYSQDGSTTKSFKMKDGSEISIKTEKNGTIEFNGKKKWTSTDGGNSWSDGSNTWRGTIKMDPYGQLIRSDSSSGKTDILYRSKESQAVADKMEQMSTKYNVTFGESGKDYSYQYKDAASDSYKTVGTKLRLPTMQELNTLEGAMKKYSHTSLTGMEFNFISGNGEGKRVSEWGWYHAGTVGKPQIYFGPSNHKSANGWDAFEGTALHEIAHHLQTNRWTADGGKTVPDTIMKFFGAEYNLDKSSNRLRDSEGKLWEHSSIRTKDKADNYYYSSRWYPVVDGKVVKEDTRARTTKQMYDSLPVDRKPCTKYFTAASESHAEAHAMLLHDPKLLNERNSDLYKAARKWDQEDINAKHGFKVDDLDRKVPKMIRGADGAVVENTKENQDKVSKMERSWPASTSKSRSRSDIKFDSLETKGKCPCCAI
ncbi:MAG: hypothetical protein K2X93_25820 [Candidatus Obscuribacterales bacterium]|nr:hypothetical protein [Candidatus Obscuribacterales bacterium]